MKHCKNDRIYYTVSFTCICWNWSFLFIYSSVNSVNELFTLHIQILAHRIQHCIYDGGASQVRGIEKYTGVRVTSAPNAFFMEGVYQHGFMVEEPIRPTSQLFENELIFSHFKHLIFSWCLLVWRKMGLSNLQTATFCFYLHFTEHSSIFRIGFVILCMSNMTRSLATICVLCSGAGCCSLPGSSLGLRCGENDSQWKAAAQEPPPCASRQNSGYAQVAAPLWQPEQTFGTHLSHLIVMMSDDQNMRNIKDSFHTL